MGITNRDGALYWATRIDNSGLKRDKQEALGIIKRMMGEITSFDVFSGIGISAGVAFAQAAKGSYNFSKEFEKNMLEVSTISSEISANFEGYQQKVIDMTKVIPVAANDSAKALYQIVSAGHDGAAGMKILEASAKSAIGGVTETATAADAITTLINSYKLNADDAGKVSDELFMTAKLGKTTFGELGQSIAQVAPIAAAYGVEMEQVLAAVATLTKSGTPTAQAMTQIRASIIGVSKYLGDGTFATKTFQEALQEVAEKAGGSESALRDMITETEAITGILGLTGIKAQGAADDLDSLNNSVGETEKAFKKMAEGTDAQLQLLQNNIVAATRPMGEAMMKQVASVANSLNEAFANGDVEKSIGVLKTLVTLLAGAFTTYKIATNMSTIQTKVDTVATNILSNVKQAYHKVIGDGIVEKERERVMQEIYIAELEKTLTAEQQVRLSKMNLTKGSKEYGNTLSDLMVKERDDAKAKIESVTKSIAKQKEKLSVAQQDLQQMEDVVAMRKRDMAAAVESNELLAIATAQEKLSTAEIERNAAARSVQNLKGKVTAQQNVLNATTTRATTVATAIDTTTTKANAAAKNVATSASFKFTTAMRTLGVAMAANPLGALLTVVSLAITAFMMFRREVKSTEDIINDLDKTTQNYADGADRITKLADDYEILQGKANRTDEENEKLKTTIASLAGIMPGVVTEFDKYGKVLDVNIEKVRQFSKEQQDANKWALNGDIETGEKRLKELDQKIERQRKIYQDGKVTRISYTPSGMGFVTVTSYEDKATSEERVKAGMEAQGLFEERNKLNEQLTKSRNTLNAIAEQHNKDAFDTLSSDLINYTNGIAEAKSRLENLENSGVWTAETSQEIENTKAVIKELGELRLLTEEKIKTFAKTAVNPAPAEKETVGVRVKKIQEELAVAEKNLMAFRAKDSTKTAAEIESAEKTVNDLKGKLATLTGVTDKRSSSTKKTYEELSKLIKDSELKLQSEQLALMADGKNKMLAQSKSEHDQREAEIKKDYDEKYKEIGKSIPEEVTVNYKQRLNTNDEAWEKRDSEIEKNSTKEIAEWYKELTGVFETEESRKTQAINARYEKEKEWLQKQKDSGGVTEEEFISYSIKIDEAHIHEELNSLLEQYKTSAEKINEIEEKSTSDINRLKKAGRMEEAAEAEKAKNDAISQIVSQTVKESDVWQKMFGELQDMSTGELKKLLESAKAELATNAKNLNPQDLKTLQDEIEKLYVTITGRNPFKAMGDSFEGVLNGFKSGDKDGITKSLNDLDGAFGSAKAYAQDLGAGLTQVFGDDVGYAIDQSMALVQATFDVGSGIAKIASGDILGGVSSVVKGIGSIFSMGKKVREMNKQLREEMHQREVDSYLAEQKVNQLYRERYEWAQKIGEANSAYAKRQGVELARQSQENAKEQADLWAKLSGTDYKASEKYIHGTLFRKAKTETDWQSLAGKSWREIEELAESNKLSDEGKKYYESLKAAKEEGKDIEQMQIEYLESMREMATGTTYDSVVGSIVDGFKAGKRSAADFADTFEDLMKGAVLKSLDMKANEKMRKWYEGFAKKGEDGYTADEMAGAKAEYMKLIEDLAKDAENLEQVTGVGIGDPEIKDGVSGQLQAAMTEGTANRVEGVINQVGIRMIDILNMNKEHLETSRLGFVDVRKIMEQSFLIEKNTRQTAENTLATVAGLKDGFDRLDTRLSNIETNTKGYNGRG